MPFVRFTNPYHRNSLQRVAHLIYNVGLYTSYVTYKVESQERILFTLQTYISNTLLYIIHTASGVSVLKLLHFTQLIMHLWCCGFFVQVCRLIRQRLFPEHTPTPVLEIP